MKKGYGQLRYDGGVEYSHRVAFISSRGRVPEHPKEVCHTCDVRHCCNPWHLFEGTRKDNMQDAKQKGRLNHNPETFHRGSAHHNSKLTEEDVARMRNENRDQPLWIIASKYGVSGSTVWTILNKITWRHVL